MRRIILLSILVCPLFLNACKKDSNDDTLPKGTPDLIVKSLVVTEKTPTSIDYDFTIQNIGDGAANMDGKTENWNLAIQAYLSTDTNLDNSDKPAGGTILGSSPLGYLDPEEELSSNFGCWFDYDISQYTYLLLKVDHSNVVEESNEDNNVFACKLE